MNVFLNVEPFYIVLLRLLEIFVSYFKIIELIVLQLGDIDAVRTLLASGVNPSVINKSGKNPFQSANSETIREAFIHELIQSAAHSK